MRTSPVRATLESSLQAHSAGPQPAVAPALSPDEVVIVSGLPRSGTSMLMQMLVSGGLTPLTDGARQADEDNPLGYLEYEPVKQIARHRDWLSGARGKVVKIVAPLLSYVPEGTPCRVVFVERNLDEILASQRQMLLRRGAAIDDSPARNTRLKTEYGRIVLSVKKMLENRAGTRVLTLHRDAVLADPRGAAEAIHGFLGGFGEIDAMAAAVKPELNRQGHRRTTGA